MCYVGDPESGVGGAQHRLPAHFGWFGRSGEVQYLFLMQLMQIWAIEIN